MSRHGCAVALALLLAALVAAGCGFGPGAGVGEVSLTVTRDYGSAPVQAPLREQASESDTVMRVLEGNAQIATRYGGGFVRSIDGLSEAVRGGSRYDWFFYVNGVESPVGAADYALRGGDAIWWDYRGWSAASQVPAVVGSWPQPLSSGYEGKSRPVALECRDAGAACGVARRKLRAAGVEPAASPGGEAIRILVGPWARLRSDPAAVQLEEGPQVSGVFADFVAGPGGTRLQGLDEGGRAGRAFGPGAGLVAATRRFDSPPVWLVSGATDRGVLAAAGMLDTAHLRDHYAIAAEGDEEVSLPLR